MLVILLWWRLIVGVRLLPVRSRGWGPTSRSLTGNNINNNQGYEKRSIFKMNTLEYSFSSLKHKTLRIR